jgi:hypothetical protein
MVERANGDIEQGWGMRRRSGGVKQNVFETDTRGSGGTFNNQGDGRSFESETQLGRRARRRGIRHDTDENHNRSFIDSKNLILLHM